MCVYFCITVVFYSDF